MKFLVFLFTIILTISSTTIDECSRIQLQISESYTIDKLPSHSPIHLEILPNNYTGFGLFSIMVESDAKDISIYLDTDEIDRYVACPDENRNFLTGVNSIYIAMKLPSTIYATIVSKTEANLKISTRFDNYLLEKAPEKELNFNYIFLMLFIVIMACIGLCVIYILEKRSEKIIVIPEKAEENNDSEVEVHVENLPDYTEVGIPIVDEQLLKEYLSLRISSVIDIKGSIYNDGVETPTTTDDDLCVVCMERKKTLLFLPCSHVVCCSHCTKLLIWDKPNCPVCRSQIKEVELYSNKNEN